MFPYSLYLYLELQTLTQLVFSILSHISINLVHTLRSYLHLITFSFLRGRIFIEYSYHILHYIMKLILQENNNIKIILNNIVSPKEMLYLRVKNIGNS